MRRLSFEFSRHVYKDVVKRNLLPGKWLLEGLLAWPGTNSTFITLFNWFCFANLLIVEVFHVNYMIANIADIKEMSAICITVITFFEALIRIFLIILKKRELNEILSEIWHSFWPVDVVEPGKRRAIKVLSSSLLSLLILMLMLACISNTQYIGAPMIKHELILKSVFPFDWDRIWMYELLYVWQYCVEWFMLFMINAFDIMFITIVAICTSQYMILQEVFRHMLDEGFGREKRILFGEDGDRLTRMELLVKCLEQHKMLNRVCEQLESSFSFILLVQFFNNVVHICILAFALKVDPKSAIKMLTLLVANLLQLFCYCFVGNELKIQSSHLADAVYESNWHLSYNKDFNRGLILMMQRAQRTQCLTAGGITELNLASFLTVIRISFSYYTLLDTLLKQ